MQTYLCRALVRFELNREYGARKDIAVIKRFDSCLAQVGRINLLGFLPEFPKLDRCVGSFEIIATKGRIFNYFSRLPFVRASRSD